MKRPYGLPDLMAAKERVTRKMHGHPHFHGCGVGEGGVRVYLAPEGRGLVPEIEAAAGVPVEVIETGERRTL